MCIHCQKLLHPGNFPGKRSIPNDSPFSTITIWKVISEDGQNFIFSCYGWYCHLSLPFSCDFSYHDSGLLPRLPLFSLVVAESLQPSFFFLPEPVFRWRFFPLLSWVFFTDKYMKMEILICSFLIENTFLKFNHLPVPLPRPSSSYQASKSRFFPYIHCKFCRVCPTTKMASATVKPSI